MSSVCWPHNQNQRLKEMKPYQQRKWLVLWCLRVISLSVLPPWLVWPLLLRRTMWLAPRRRQQAPAHREGWQRNCETSRGLNCLLKANMYVFNWITFLKNLPPSPGIARIASVASSHSGHAHCCHASWWPPWPLTRLQQGLFDVPLPWIEIGFQIRRWNQIQKTHDKSWIKAVKTLLSALEFPKTLFLFFSFCISSSTSVVLCCHAPWVADPKCKIGHANRGVTPRTKTMDSVNAWRC